MNFPSFSSSSLNLFNPWITKSASLPIAFRLLQRGPRGLPSWYSRNPHMGRLESGWKPVIVDVTGNGTSLIGLLVKPRRNTKAKMGNFDLENHRIAIWLLQPEFKVEWGDSSGRRGEEQRGFCNLWEASEPGGILFTNWWLEERKWRWAKTYPCELSDWRREGLPKIECGFRLWRKNPVGSERRVEKGWAVANAGAVEAERDERGYFRRTTAAQSYIRRRRRRSKQNGGESW